MFDTRIQGRKELILLFLFIRVGYYLLKFAIYKKMAFMPHPKVTKIPGELPVIKSENHLKDLTQLTRLELLDLNERETKLSADKKKLQQLPDKGLRIQNLYRKIKEELARRANIEETAARFSELNIASKGREAMNNLEWNRNLKAQNEQDPMEDILYSDDEAEIDPLRILAKCNMHKRQVRVLPPEKTLISEDDLKEIKSFKCATTGGKGEEEEKEEGDEGKGPANLVQFTVRNNNISQLKEKMKVLMENHTNNEIMSNESNSPTMAEVERHVLYLVDKVEVTNRPQRDKFKPYKTTISNVHDPEKEMHRKKGKHWEVTAATPPLIQHNGTKMLNLLDSLEIQTKYLAKLNELQEKQAAARLAAKIERLRDRKVTLPPDSVLKQSTLFTSYRSSSYNEIEGDELLNGLEQTSDQDDEDFPGCVVRYQSGE